jgi:PhoH-like ATPase
MNLLMDPEVDFVTLTGTAGTGKNPAGAGRRPHTGAGRPPLYRDHHDPRHRERGRGHRLFARHRGRKDGPLDGSTGRQPRISGQGRRRQRGRVGPCSHQRTHPQPHQDQEHELHARPHLPEQIRDHRRGAKPDAQADENADHPRRPRHQDHLHGQPGTDRHTPTLTEGSSGLTYAVDRFKGWPHSGHITLARGERSRLADFASEVL